MCGVPALEVVRVHVLCADQKKSGLWGRDYVCMEFCPWPLKESEAGVELVLTQISMLFLSKSRV